MMFLISESASSREAVAETTTENATEATNARRARARAGASRAAKSFPRKRAGKRPASRAKPPAATVVAGMQEIFKLLSDEMRLRILLTLNGHKEFYVGALCDQLGEVQSSVSHHLALLLAAGLIRRRRVGKRNYYSLATGPIEALLRLAFKKRRAGESLQLGRFVISRRSR